MENFYTRSRFAKQTFAAHGAFPSMEMQGLINKLSLTGNFCTRSRFAKQTFAAHGAFPSMEMLGAPV